MADKQEDELENGMGQVGAIDSADTLAVGDVGGLGMVADAIDSDNAKGEAEGKKSGDQMNATTVPENYHPEETRLEADEMTEAERQSVPSSGQPAEQNAAQTKGAEQGTAPGVEAQSSEQNQQWKAWGAGVQERTSNEPTAEASQGQEQGEGEGEEAGKDNDSAMQAQRHNAAHQQEDEQARGR